MNIDPTSANYLADTVVYDFFDYEVGQGSYCKSIRVANLSGQTEMAWGKDGSGNDVVFMARVGENYEVRPENPPNEPGNCNPWVFEGRPMDKIYGRMFALRPTDPADLSKPWTYALGYDNPASPARAPSTRSSPWGGRSTGTRTEFGLVPVRACAGPPRDPDRGGQMYFYKAGTNSVRASTGRCSTGPTSRAACSRSTRSATPSPSTPASTAPPTR